MPFIQRVVQPVDLNKPQKKSKILFQEFSDVSNFTLTGALLQLSSLCHHAEDIFAQLHKETCAFNKRCKGVSEKIKRLQVTVDIMDAKTVQIPVSDLDVERGLPLHLHYHAPNSLEEDLFTMDSRSPCVIQLHQRTRQDINHYLRGSEVYSRAPRPKSLDPRLLMDSSFVYDDIDPYSPRSPRNSSFMTSSARINPKIKQQQEQEQQRRDVPLPTPDQKMKIDSSSSNTDIIKVDTSGAKFERQANLRRSQRLSSSSSVRQRANAAQRRQQRHKHKTLTGLPGNVSSEIGDRGIRPYSLHSDANGSSFVEGSSDESRSMINGHAVVSPNQRNAEIQTDDVKVIPLTPSQRRMRQKGIKSINASPASSHGSTEFLLESPTAVPCPTVPKMKQTSTPINGVLDREIIRPTTLDVKNNDSSTDEGRHTGESNPPTPVRTGTPQELSASPQLKKSPNSPMATKHPHSNSNHNNNERPNNIAMRMNGARLQQGEDRASSGCWSGTESAQHSSSSDITMQHAPVINALQHMVKNRKPHSPVFSNSAGQISPIIANRPLICSSAVSTSSVSINSKLSTLDIGSSNPSLYRDDDERFQSANSSVVNITLNRSNNTSTLSLNSNDSGTAISAAAMLKKSRKSRLNATGGAYNFMNYEVDPLQPTADELPRAVKNRRSTRSMKRHGGSKKLLGSADDTLSVSSLADSSPQNTDPDAHSVHSGGLLTNDSTSLCESMFSENPEGYYVTMHDEYGTSKNSPVYTVSATSMPDSVSPDIKPVTPTPVVIEPVVEVQPASPVFDEGTRNISGEENRAANYNSYNRAVKSNHATPKSLLSPRGKSASVKSPKSQPALDFQAELNKRLSVRRVPNGNKASIKKEKRGLPPPPPKRASSLSSSSSPSPSPSVKSMSDKEHFPVMSPTVISTPVAPADSPVFASPPPQKVLQSPEDFYKTTPPPPPPIDQLPPPPPELLEAENKTPIKSSGTHAGPPAPPAPSVPAPQPPTTPHIKIKSPTSPNSPRSPVQEESAYHSIAMQAALLGNRLSQKKKEPVKNNAKSDAAVKKSNKLDARDVTKEYHTAVVAKTTPQAAPIKIPPPTAPKMNHIPPISKVAPPTAPKTTHVTPVAKTPPQTAPKTTSPPPAAEILPKTEAPTAPKTTHVTTPVTKTSPPTAAKTTSISSAPKTEALASPNTTHVTPVTKTPPPTAAKTTSPLLVAEVSTKTEASTSSKTTHVTPVTKIPPPTAHKTTSITPAAEITPKTEAPVKIPPPVATKPPNPAEDFTARRSREQSPSYKASVARAAFFNSVTSTPPTVAPKPAKVPLITSTPKSEKEKAEEKKSTVPETTEKADNLPQTNTEQNKAKKEEIPTNNTQELSKDAETPLDATDNAPTGEVFQPKQPSEVQTPDSIDWLEKIEEFSSPNHAQKDSTSDVTSEQESAASRLGLTSTQTTPKYSTYENLMAAIHNESDELPSSSSGIDDTSGHYTQTMSKRETLSGKSVSSSPPSSPGTNGEAFTYRNNGNKSPGNTLEKKRNGRLSSNGHRNGISRKSNGSTSRDNFKALLLQNACRGSSGSQMTAAEKLQLNKPQASAAAALSRQRPLSMNDAEMRATEEAEQADGTDENSETSRPMLSLNDIRSAITSGSATTSRIGRSNRRGPRPNSGVDPKYATFSAHGKKHPPPSLSSKYNTRSRTPTRAMMSIDEDSETEKSPEQIHSYSRIQQT